MTTFLRYSRYILSEVILLALIGTFLYTTGAKPKIMYTSITIVVCVFILTIYDYNYPVKTHKYLTRKLRTYIFELTAFTTLAIILLIWNASLILSIELFGGAISIAIILNLKNRYLMHGVSYALRDIQTKYKVGVLLLAVLGLMIYFKLSIEAISFSLLFISFLLYRWDSRVPAGAALISLVTCPVLLTLQMEPEAEKMAVYAYYFLVITVGLQIIEYALMRPKGAGMPVRSDIIEPEGGMAAAPVEMTKEIIQTNYKRERIVVYFLGAGALAFLVGTAFFAGVYFAPQIRGTNSQKISQKQIIVPIVTASATPSAVPTTVVTKDLDSRLRGNDIGPSVTPTETASTEADLSAYTIRILNGSGKAGEAARLMKTLTVEGFKVSRIGTALKNNYQTTQVSAKQTVDQAYQNKLKEILDKTYITVASSQISETASQEADVIITIGKAAAK